MRPIFKVFFLGLVLFLFTFVPLDSLLSLYVLAGQPDSESTLKRFRETERDLISQKEFEPIDAKSCEVPTGYFTEPCFLDDKILVTNDAYSTIYLIEDSTLLPLITTPGCGYKYTISYDQRMIGLKIINENGLQSPTVFDLSTNNLVPLHEPVPLAGQVSFSNDGKFAFTIGNELIVRKGSEEESFDLGTYSNLTRISPDGLYVAYNDNDDQIWMINLRTREKICLTDRISGYFDPLWSPDSRKIALSTLSGIIKVYDLTGKKLYTVGGGGSPSWSPDAEYLIYYITETDGHELISSELFISKFDGGEKTQLTNTPDILEMDPRFSPDGEKLTFHTYSRREVVEGVFEGVKLIRDFRTIFKLNKNLQIHYREDNNGQMNYKEKGDYEFGATKSINVPYIHQVCDTPDWFNGSCACAPTTALMAIVYYRKLPDWDTWCTYGLWCPPPHTSHWGRYICEQYNYREITYSLEAYPSGCGQGKGGYGYMWYNYPTYSPHSRMATYLNNHGLTSWTDDTPSWSEVVAELDNNYPYAVCCSLTEAGHLILSVGYVSGQHTIICNDPYGNKNTPPYPNYDGKDVRYDWPGYNNGYANLNRVYWAVGARGTFPVPSDTIVDDYAIDDGFYMHTAPPSTMAYWWDALIGYRGHMWWTLTSAATSVDTCYATWTPNLPQAGDYEVFAYIPSNNATATSAKYRIYYSGGNQTVTVNQNIHSNEWVSLGTYPFGVGSGGYVRLGDATGIWGQKIGFDAIKWSYKPADEPPIVDYFNVTPTSVTLGNSFTISYTVSDDIGLYRIELWRANDSGGNPVGWDSIQITYISGTNYSDSFSDAPASTGTYWYGVHVKDNAGQWSHEPDPPGPTQVTVTGTGVGDEDEMANLPKSFALYQNYPNPFNPATEIKCVLPKNCHVKLVVYNILGRKVRTLVDKYLTKGQKSIYWDGKDDQGSQLASGIYFYRLQAGAFSETKKMVLLR